ncbi:MULTISPECIES: recombinase family protein [Clostridium]|uniref:recombinase family protein n=1 Tax=Clostridium TaxID=1485 RepID=UPI000825FBCE|nr:MULTISPECIES: recombinase family protein [Clostridium]PJI09788.1 DNA invertase Pin [Clostridium sp. CT7]
MNIVGYVRLSRDEDKENYSSVISQKNIIKEYAKSRNWTVSRIYVDDNCSGYTFNRTDFLSMIEEIKNRKIDVIIAKDLSRIGRNNGKVLVFIDKLREVNVRLILVEEANGGLDLLNDNSDILGIKTWYNEMYVKDISRKIRASMYLKQKKGELIMGNFYGYKKIKVGDDFKLIVDEKIKPVVQFIFGKYIQGCGYKKICDLLDVRGCPTPSEYIQKRHKKKGRVFKNAVTHKWQTHMINRIIKNDIYIGTLRTRKRQARMIKGKQEMVPRDEQYVFENHHEPIISKEDFLLAQEINSRRNKVNFRGRAKYNYIFSSFMQCGECKHAIIGCNLRSQPAVRRGYNCGMYRKYGNKVCSNHAVSEDEILFFFKEFLKDVKVKYADYILSIGFTENMSIEQESIDRMKKELSIEEEELQLILSEKISELVREKDQRGKDVIEDAYVKVEDEKKKSILNLKKKIEKSKKENSRGAEKKLKTAVEIFDNIIDSEIPTREDLERILDKIVVYKDRNLEFKLKINIDKLTYKNS